MLEASPTQPNIKNCPKTVNGFGKTTRMRSVSFNSCYNHFNWIEYSDVDDSVDCFHC